MNQDTTFSPELLTLPYVGEISSGKCLDKNKTIDQINIPAYLLPSTPAEHNKCFVVKMSGGSMQASGILNDDLLIIKSCSTAKNNKIVIATIDNLESVIKHFEQTNDLIILSSKNPDIKPMIFDPSRIKIVGILVAQLRSYNSKS